MQSLLHFEIKVSFLVITHCLLFSFFSRVTAVDGHYQIGIYSVRKIQHREEITFDYNSVTEVCPAACNLFLFQTKNVSAVYLLSNEYLLCLSVEQGGI